MSNKIKDFWASHDQNILVILAIFLVSLVSFQTGKNSQKMEQAEIIQVNLASTGGTSPSLKKNAIDASASGSPLSTKENSSQSKAGKGNLPPSECKFVASKSSNKYHLPGCRYAVKINEGNRVCFSSEDEARNRGYQPAKCCIK